MVVRLIFGWIIGLMESHSNLFFHALAVNKKWKVKEFGCCITKKNGLGGSYLEGGCVVGNNGVNK